EILVLIDPSGYVYDTSDDNRIEDMSTTLYQLVDANGDAVTSITGPDEDLDGSVSDEEEGTTSGDAVGLIDGCYTTPGTLDTDLCSWSSWDATASGQVNPSETDSEGKYGWNVPQGWYRVAFQKTGAYSASYSRDVYVPPAETSLDLNLGAYDIGAPAIASVNPANESSSIARNVQPKVVFSEPMLASTINSTNIKLLNEGSPVTTSLSYDESSRTVTIAPGSTLAASTVYTIRVTTGVTDDTSNALASTANYTFTTGAEADSTPPVSTASVASGTYNSTQTVTLSATDSAVSCTNCIIYYTLDGSSPTTSSSVYSSALTISTTKTLKFFAVDAASNEETPVNSRTYTLVVSVPGVPQNFAANAMNSSSTSLTWDAVSGATSYKVYRSTVSGSYGAAIATPTSGLYADYELALGTYYYKVSAVNAAGESSLSGEKSVILSRGGSSVPRITEATGTSSGGTASSDLALKISSFNANAFTSTIGFIVKNAFVSPVTISQPLQLNPSLISINSEKGTKSALLTDKNGSLTLRPNEVARISLKVPANTSVTGTMDWDGYLIPPLVKPKTIVDSKGEVITGETSLLMQESIETLVFVGSNRSPLTFSNEVSLNIPVGLKEGALAKIYTSADGNTWAPFNKGALFTIKENQISFKTKHFSYFAFLPTGKSTLFSYFKDKFLKTTPTDEAILTPFSDISKHWAKSYIMRLYNLGVISSNTSLRFEPERPITRAELVKIALNAFGYDVPAVGITSVLKDLDASQWYAPYVQVATDHNIVSGYPDGTFRPNQLVTRAEALKILFNAAKVNVAAVKAVSSFKDVLVTAWYAKYVSFAKDKSIVSGYANGKFKPEQSVTRAEAVKIVTQLMDLGK
ncbi:MAG: S-layer homology domain-containing protein, partial [Patescibacteria group bacterium]